MLGPAGAAATSSGGLPPSLASCRFGRLQQVVDAGGEGVDLRRQRVDLIEQHPGQFGVVVVEAAVERLDQRRSLGLHPAPGQVGQAPRVTLAGDQRLDHVPRRQRVQRGRHRRHLDQRVFEQLLQPLPVPGAFPGQIDPQPGVVAQLPDRRRRHERGPQQPFLGELGQPHRVELVGLGPAGHVLHVAGVDQLHVQPGRLQQVVPDPPVVRGGLHGDLLDPQLDQLIGQVGDRAGGGLHVPHLADPRRSRGVRTHTVPDALATSIAHTRSITSSCSASGISSGTGLCFGFDLNSLVLQSRPHIHRAGCPGASVKGTEILTGVLEATVRDPSRSGPGARLMCGLAVPRKHRRRQATRPHFHACEASRKRNWGLMSRCARRRIRCLM